MVLAFMYNFHILINYQSAYMDITLINSISYEQWNIKKKININVMHWLLKLIDKTWNKTCIEQGIEYWITHKHTFTHTQTHIILANMLCFNSVN